MVASLGSMLCASGRKYKMGYCKLHQVFYLKKYPHVCDGVAVSVVESLKGVKRSKNKKKVSGTASGGKK